MIMPRAPCPEQKEIQGGTTMRANRIPITPRMKEGESTLGSLLAPTLRDVSPLIEC